ncbi:MAG: SufD family Fe-S cluster assembly protein [Bdellovibrionia bacterium]
MNFEKLFNQQSQIKPVQSDYFAHFQKLGLPTKALESWHYTSAKSAFQHDYAIGQAGNKNSSATSLMNQKKGWHNISFVNGALSAAFSSESKQWVRVVEASVEAPQDGIEALAGAFATESYEISLPASFLDVAKLELDVTTTENSLAALDLQVKLAAQQKMVLLLNMQSHSEPAAVCLPKIKIDLGEGAECTFVYLQDVNSQSFEFSNVKIELQENAKLNFLNLSLGGKVSRQSLEVNIRGSNCEVIANGLLVLSGEQHVDNTTSINHHIGGSQSFQLYKGILDGSSRSAFTGKVYIAKDAQKANSEQLNNNLLLSNNAEADSRPMLQIYADDVKAAHGSTVGQLNADEIFYLQSRAISKENAVKILAYGYVADLLFKLQDAELELALSHQLKNSFAKIEMSHL